MNSIWHGSHWKTYIWVIVGTTSLREFLTWENWHFCLDFDESWALCSYHCLPDVRKTLHTCLSHLVPAPLPIPFWCCVRIQGSWLCVGGIFLKARMVRANDCKPCMHVSSSQSQKCLYCSFERPSYSINYTGANTVPKGEIMLFPYHTKRTPIYTSNKSI